MAFLTGVRGGGRGMEANRGTSWADLYGIKYPCFARFQCNKCTRKWKSTCAWRHTGQECRHCARGDAELHILAKGTGHEPVFYYACDNCKKAYKYKEEEGGIPCPTKKCEAVDVVMPPLTHVEFKKLKGAYMMAHLDMNPKYEDGTKRYDHETKLCEKCMTQPEGSCWKPKLSDEDGLLPRMDSHSPKSESSVYSDAAGSSGSYSADESDVPMEQDSD